jgi:hypothetical protein
MGNQLFRARVLVGALLLAAALAACSSDSSESGGGATTTAAPEQETTTTVGADDDLKLNQIQVIGTHNSFHTEPPPDELAQLAALDAEQAEQRRYTHQPLATQLEEQKVRQLELDVFADSKGGLYEDPAFAPEGSAPLAGMGEPGTKVLHEQDVDYHSVCPTFEGCLEEVRSWSEDHPGHVPIAIHVQFKDGPLIFDVPDQAVPEKWTTEAMDGLDEEIRSVFAPEQVITPDDVRGEYDTLEQAVLAGNWPTLGESRGKVLFLMINPEPYRSIYLEGHDGLEGRVLFTNAQPGQPDASYVGIDDPVAEGDRITELVELGYLVRTRSDANGVDAEADDTTRLEAALASGAQWISTDYPGPDGAQEQYGTDFTAQLPDFLAARCNPVTAPPGCVDAAVEP